MSDTAKSKSLADSAGTVESAVAELRSQILAGQLAPRQRLVEPQLCRELGVSRFVLRSAFAELASAGLVEVERNVGARVRSVSLDEAIEITGVRLILECHAAALAAERATEGDVTELRALEHEMQEAVGNGELLTYSELNATFHELLRTISGNETNTRMIGHLKGQVITQQFAFWLQPGRPSVSLAQHERIIDAVVAHDPEAAASAMREHLTNVIEVLRSFAPRR